MNTLVVVTGRNRTTTLIHADYIEAHDRVELLGHLHQDRHVLAYVFLRHEVLIVILILYLIGSLIGNLLIEFLKDLHVLFVAKH